MDDFQRAPNRFLNWPYYGSPDDAQQDAHDALERAAEAFLPPHQQTHSAPRRGRPRRRPEAPRGGG
jgi:hypothetical protein